MSERRRLASEYLSGIMGRFLDGGDKNSQGYAAIIVFGILAAAIIWSYFYPAPCDPF